MTFNEKIDAFMQKNGIPNLKQFSLLAGIPYTTLRDFYDKQSADNSRLSTIRKLSNYMNCSMDYLAYDDITETNEIKLDGLDIDEDSDYNNDKEFVTKITLNNEEDKSSVINYLEKNDFQYQILPNVSKQPNDLEVLFSKAKDKLDPSQQEIIKFVMNDAIKKYEEEKNGNLKD